VIGVFGPSLLVSIPGAQLAPLALPGSVFRWTHLRDAVLPSPLRLALALVIEAAEARGVRLRFVARPEIFTHGRARVWLNEQIGDAADHLALTDGDTLRTLPGLRNHMFFYGRGDPVQEAALSRLLRVAPELFAGLASQLNGGTAVRLDGRWIRPSMRALGFALTPRLEPPVQVPFLCHPGNPDKAAFLSAEAAATEEEVPRVGRPVHFIPLCAGALADRVYVEPLIRLLQRAALGGEREPVVLGLPLPASTEATLPDRICTTLRALAAAGMPYSRVDFSKPEEWGVRFVTAPPCAADLVGGTITLHPGSPFWLLGADLYAAAARIQVMGSTPITRLRVLFGEWLGPEVRIDRANGAAMAVGVVP
jgi:hypothetical protein